MNHIFKPTLYPNTFLLSFLSIFYKPSTERRMEKETHTRHDSGVRTIQIKHKTLYYDM